MISGLQKFALSITLMIIAGMGTPVRADPLSANAIRQLVDEEMASAVMLYREFLQLPNNALRPQDIEHLILWMEQAFTARGFVTQRIPTAGSPALYAERLVDEAGETALIYLQADGQPVDPSAWNQPDPYSPVLKSRNDDGGWAIIPWSSLDSRYDPEWRIFARSASDSKGPMTQFMMAMQLLDAAGRAPRYNLKVIVDTEEELGSPNLAAAVEAHRTLLSSDLLLIFDGPPHASNRPTVTFGARGIATVTLVAHGPRVAQHSGHYGNFVPNPAFDLSRILASLKSPDGVVQIPGFYDGVSLSDRTRAVLAKVPDNEEAILEGMGVLIPDAVAPTLQEAIQYPSLNIRGMAAAWIGDQARTIIPPTATAEIDIRLVRESDPAYLIGLLRSHIKKLGYHVLDRYPTDEERRQQQKIVTMTHQVSYAAFRSDFDSPAGMMARAGLRHLYGEEPVLIRTMGGSIPIAPIIDALGIPAAIVPSVNIDNNQHSPNENIRLGNFIEGIAMLMSVLDQSPSPLLEATD